MKIKRLLVIVEKGDDLFSARTVSRGKLLVPNGYGATPALALKNMMDVIRDYVQQEGKDDKYWANIAASKVVFDIRYDLQSFFMDHDYLNTTAIAKRAGINAGLVRQYTSGVKHPSETQAKKIEATIHKLAKELQQVSLIA